MNILKKIDDYLVSKGYRLVERENIEYSEVIFIYLKSDSRITVHEYDFNPFDIQIDLECVGDIFSSSYEYPLFISFDKADFELSFQTLKSYFNEIH